jgi:hypothetical protein
MIYCQVERDAISSVKNVNFDLMKNSYYLLLASGSAIRANTVDYHDILREASQAPLKLSLVSNIGSKSKLLLRLHGAFMLVAWIGTSNFFRKINDRTISLKTSSFFHSQSIARNIFGTIL